ncbi:MAG: membrane dipeptidase [Elusimicrobia bacterium]|nr:membrane dipeptidase [Elusimicrobiota bacterium]
MIFLLLILLAPLNLKAATIDLHLHMATDVALPLFFDGRPSEGPAQAQKHTEIFKNQISVKDLRAGNVRLVMATIYAFDVVSHLRGGYLKEIHRQIEAIEKWTEENSETAMIVRSPQDAEAVLSSNEYRLGLILAVEGTHGVTSQAAVDSLYDAGVRMITIAHMSKKSPWAGAADIRYVFFSNCLHKGKPNSKRNPIGLTELGKELLPYAVKKGILIDLAHSSDRTFRDVTAQMPNMPLLFSHEAARELTPCERTVDQAKLDYARKSGSMVGLSFDARRTGGTIADLLEHAKIMVRDGGYGVLALGTDFNGFPPRAQGLATTEGLAEVLSSLEQAGVTGPRQSAENFLNLWRRFLGYSAHIAAR